MRTRQFTAIKANIAQKMNESSFLIFRNDAKSLFMVLRENISFIKETAASSSFADTFSYLFFKNQRQKHLVVRLLLKE